MTERELNATHFGSCDTAGCENRGIVFDAYSQGSVLQPIICGGCMTEFTDRCVPKETP